MIVLDKYRIPIKLWFKDINDLDHGALEQAINLANMPYAFKHIAIMPDSHEGYGMPIGGVLATENVIVPNAVGVDIGCGMNAVKTSIPVEDMTYSKVKEVMERAARKIPVGMNKHQEKVEKAWMPDPTTYHLPVKSIVKDNYESARYQLGTLGGGNHFIEMQAGSDGFVWLMLHSGSRRLGLDIGTFYNNQAKAMNAKWFNTAASNVDLAFLPVDETEQVYMNYLAEMNYAMDYAFHSRKKMMVELQHAVNQVFPNVEFPDEMINISHNFASLEKHFGKKVWVHRKGAVQAMENQLGIIPGSQGTASYITRGKGNRESFMSSSHGAGRVMSRKKARNELNLQSEMSKMEGIYNNMTTQASLDEAPSAYKNIDEVMDNQKDLVDIMVKLRPLGNLKG